jgi:hypothetical protein
MVIEQHDVAQVGRRDQKIAHCAVDLQRRPATFLFELQVFKLENQITFRHVLIQDGRLVVERLNDSKGACGHWLLLRGGGQHSPGCRQQEAVAG